MGRSWHSVSRLERVSKTLCDALFSNYLSSCVDSRAQYALKRHAFTSDVAVQTDSAIIASDGLSPGTYERTKDNTEEDDLSSMNASDLASILKWSKDISSDINLPMALQRLTEIATGRRSTYVLRGLFISLCRELRKSIHLCGDRSRSRRLHRSNKYDAPRAMSSP